MAGTTNLQIVINANASQARSELARFASDIRTLFRQLNERGRTSIGGIPLSQITSQIQQLQQQAVNANNAIAQSVQNTTRAQDAATKSTKNWYAEYTRLLSVYRQAGSGFAGDTVLKDIDKLLKSRAGVLRDRGGTAEQFASVDRAQAYIETLKRSMGVSVSKAEDEEFKRLVKQGLVSPIGARQQTDAAQQIAKQNTELKLQARLIDQINAARERGIKNITVGTRSTSQFAALGNYGPTVEVSPKEKRTIDAMGGEAYLQKLAGSTDVVIHKQSALKEMMGTTANMMKSQISWFAGAGAIFAITGAIAAATKATLDFYQNLKNIQAVTGESDAGIRKIAASAIDVAKNTPIAASEASKLGLTLIQAGLNSEQAAEAMKTVSAIVTVSGEDMTTVSKAVTTAMFSWHKSAKDIPDIGNSIAAALNFSRLTVTDLGTAFNYLASTSSIMGRSLNETVSIMATLSNAGIRASTIGTGMSQLFTQLLVPTKQLEAELSRMGLSANDINPQMHKFADIVELLQSKGFSAAKAMHLLGDRAGREMAAAMVMGADAFREMETKIENSKQLQDGLKKAMEGPINAIKNLRNQIEISAITIGSVGVPIFNTLISTLKAVTSIAVTASAGFSIFPAIFGSMTGPAAIVGGLLLVLAFNFNALTASIARATAAGITFRGVLTLISTHPLIIGATAIITVFSLIGLLFNRTGKQAEELAKAIEAKNKAMADGKAIADTEAAKLQIVEQRLTGLKEAWDDLGRKKVNISFLGLAPESLDLSAFDKKMQSLTARLADIEKKRKLVETSPTYSFVLDGLKKEEGSLRNQIELLKTRNALYFGGTGDYLKKLSGLSPEKMADEAIKAGMSSNEMTFEQKMADMRKKAVSEFAQVKEDLLREESMLSYMVATKVPGDALKQQQDRIELARQTFNAVGSAWKQWAEGITPPTDKDNGASRLADQTEKYRNALADAVRDTARLKEEIVGLQDIDPYTKIRTQTQKQVDELLNEVDKVHSSDAANQEQGLLLTQRAFELYQQIGILRRKEEIQIQELQKEGFERLLKWSQEWDDKLRQRRESEINRQLSLVDLSEKDQSITALNANTQRILLMEQLLRQQEATRDKFAGMGETYWDEWNEAENAVIATRSSLYDLYHTRLEWTGTALQGFKYGLKQYVEDPALTTFNQMKQMATDTAQAISNSFSTFFMDAFKGELKSGREYFEAFLESIMSSLSKMLADKITREFLAAFGQTLGAGAGTSTTTTSTTSTSGGYTLGGNSLNTYGLTANANGNVYSGSGISAYSNKIVTRPTFFAFAKGAGVMGEAGWEAVMPLTRTRDGKLGVKSQGVSGGNVNVAINVQNQTGKDVEIEQSSLDFDGEQFVVGVIMKAAATSPSFRNGLRSALQ